MSIVSLLRCSSSSARCFFAASLSASDCDATDPRFTTVNGKYHKDIWPDQWNTKRQSDAVKYYKSTPEEFIERDSKGEIIILWLARTSKDSGFRNSGTGAPLKQCFRFKTYNRNEQLNFVRHHMVRTGNGECSWLDIGK